MIPTCDLCGKKFKIVSARANEATQLKHNCAMQAERAKFGLELLRMQDRAARLKLWRTHHVIDNAKTEYGWEVAEQLKIHRGKKK